MFQVSHFYLWHGDHACTLEPDQTSPVPSESPLPTARIPASAIQQTNLAGTFWTNTAWNDPDVHPHPSGSDCIMYLSRNTQDLYTDGRRFSTPVKVLGQGPLYPIGQAWLGYSTPSALVRNSKLELYSRLQKSFCNRHAQNRVANHLFHLHDFT